MDEKHQSTEGEKILEYYLEDQGIKCSSEYELTWLKGDSRSVRRADFYLPQYGVYLEFLGKWNDVAARAEYKEKMSVYADNGIPCLYIYPENLGALDLLFKMRMEELFKTFPALWFQKLKFRFWKFGKALEKIILLWLMMTLGAIFIENLFNGRLSLRVYSLLIPVFLAVVFLIYAVKLIFWKNSRVVRRVSTNLQCCCGGACKIYQLFCGS